MGFRHREIHRRRWANLRLKILDRDGYKCVLCGRHGQLEIDHIKPLTNGGDIYNPNNLQTLCKFCHKLKTETETGSRPDGRRAWMEKLRHAF